MLKIAAPREIIDRRALLSQLDAIAQDCAPDQLRDKVLSELTQALKRGTEVIRQRLLDGVSGRDLAKERAFLVDQVIRVLYDVTLSYIYPMTNPTKSEHLGLVAVGGYGRAELAPFSDIDLLFLLPYKQTPWGEQVVETMLYVLWDLGLKVGYSVRSLNECISMSREDLTIRTAMLEARFLWGDKDLFDELKVRFDKEVVAGTGPEFVEAKLAERNARHERMGDTRYVVEPNLKDGKGGLRDLQTLYWLAKYLYRTDDVGELVKQGVLTAAEQRRFDKADNYLWNVRFHLHDIAGRPEERLTFDVQSELAARLGYRERGRTSGVERFMKHYFLNAKEVGDLTRIFCAHLEEQHQKKPLLRLPRLGLRRRSVDGFAVEGDRVGFASEDEIKEEPINMLRLFWVAQKHEFDIHPEALRLITRNLGRIDAKLRNDPEANALFLEILTSKKDPALTLRRLNEAGVFGRFVPDFGRVVAQMQHDMYHHYTVDEHTIRAIEILSKIESGVLADDHPLSNVVIHKLLSRRVLYAAMLLHDIAKGRGGDHSVLGAEIAEKLCPRFGFSEAETETTAWLVRHHLVMSNVAFKRDIADPKTVEDFAEVVQSPERLRLLVVLTVCDIRAVGPGVYNGWKGQLLRDLYERAEDYMTGGRTAERASERAEAARQDLRERLSDWADDDFEAYARRYYDTYWTSTPIETQIEDARLISGAEQAGEPMVLANKSDSFRAVTQLTLYCEDHPGLFSRLSGALAIGGASIVDAKISTTKDGMALDHFSVQDTEGNAYIDKGKLERLERLIHETLSGDIHPHEILAQPSAVPSRTRKVFTVAPVVLIDNNASETHTVVEVNGRDRPGLLFDLARALFDLKLRVHSAHIATFGERAVDVFYLRDLFGHKITHEGKQRAIEKRLLVALQDPQMRAQEKDPKDASPAVTAAE